MQDPQRQNNNLWVCNLTLKMYSSVISLSMDDIEQLINERAGKVFPPSYFKGSGYYHWTKNRFCKAVREIHHSVSKVSLLQVKEEEVEKDTVAEMPDATSKVTTGEEDDLSKKGTTVASASTTMEVSSQEEFSFLAIDEEEEDEELDDDDDEEEEGEEGEATLTADLEKNSSELFSILMEPRKWPSDPGVRVNSQEEAVDEVTVHCAALGQMAKRAMENAQNIAQNSGDGSGFRGSKLTIVSFTSLPDNDSLSHLWNHAGVGSNFDKELDRLAVALGCRNGMLHRDGSVEDENVAAGAGAGCSRRTTTSSTQQQSATAPVLTFLILHAAVNPHHQSRSKTLQVLKKASLNVQEAAAADGAGGVRHAVVLVDVVPQAVHPTLGIATHIRATTGFAFTTAATLASIAAQVHRLHNTFPELRICVETTRTVCYAGTKASTNSSSSNSLSKLSFVDINEGPKAVAAALLQLIAAVSATEGEVRVSSHLYAQIRRRDGSAAATISRLFGPESLKDVNGTALPNMAEAQKVYEAAEAMEKSSVAVTSFYAGKQCIPGLSFFPKMKPLSGQSGMSKDKKRKVEPRFTKALEQLVKQLQEKVEHRQTEMIPSKDETAKSKNTPVNVEPLNADQVGNADVVLPVDAGPVGNADVVLPVDAGPVGNADVVLPVDAGPVGNADVVLPVDAGPVGNADVVLPVDAAGPVGNADVVLPVDAGPEENADVVLPVDAGPVGNADVVPPVDDGPALVAIPVQGHVPLHLSAGNHGKATSLYVVRTRNVGAIFNAQDSENMIEVLRFISIQASFTFWSQTIGMKPVTYNTWRKYIQSENFFLADPTTILNGEEKWRYIIRMHD